VPATLYGFNGCDTVKKARKWLEAHGVAHEFFDYRKDRLDPETVERWFRKAGWEAVFNRNSTTFKEFSDAVRASIDEGKAKEMILAETNLIKRPVLDLGERVYAGFKPEVYSAAFDK
jgi:arsenate reductase